MCARSNWLCWLLLYSLVGCGVEPPPGLVPASGAFRWDTGEPVLGHQGILRFHHFDPAQPAIETSALSAEMLATARVGADGRFTVVTSLERADQTREFGGIRPGTYKVLLFLMPPAGVAENIHPDYNHPVRSPILVEIHPEGANHLQLTLERRFQGWDPAVAAVDRTQAEWELPVTQSESGPSEGK